MRNWRLLGLVVAVALAALAAPTLSQEPTRIGAMFDVSVLTQKLDSLAQAMTDLKKQNEELKKAAADANKALEGIGVGVAALRTPMRWEYKFFRASEKVANKLGEEGWELITIDKDNWFIFRRPLAPEARAEGGGAVPGAQP